MLPNLADIQADIFSIVILGILLFNSNEKIPGQNVKLFNHLILSTTIILFLDIAMFCVDGINLTLNYIISLLYYVFTPVVGFTAMIYFSYLNNRSIKRIKTLSYIMIPFFVFYIIICLLNYKTKWLFTITEDSIYKRGRFFWISELICFLFIVYPCIISLISYFKTKERNYLFTAFLILPPFVGTVIQIYSFGVSLNWLGTVISIFMIFIKFQNKQLSTDPLTTINNSRMLYKYLENKISSYTGKERMFIFVFDVDSFKEINDTYGHLEGDKALKCIAKFLNCVCLENDDFLARMGGDEFCIIAIRNLNENIDPLIDSLQSQIDSFNKSNYISYKISLSYGYCEYGYNNVVTLDDCIKQADIKMYESKKNKHIKER